MENTRSDAIPTSLDCTKLILTIFLCSILGISEGRNGKATFVGWLKSQAIGGFKTQTIQGPSIDIRSVIKTTSQR